MDDHNDTSLSPANDMIAAPDNKNTVNFDPGLGETIRDSDNAHKDQKADDATSEKYDVNEKSNTGWKRRTFSGGSDTLIADDDIEPVPQPSRTSCPDNGNFAQHSQSKPPRDSISLWRRASNLSLGPSSSVDKKRKAKSSEAILTKRKSSIFTWERVKKSLYDRKSKKRKNAIPRLVDKDGTPRVTRPANTTEVSSDLKKDPFFFLVGLGTRMLFVVFALTYIFCWLFFGCIWYGVSRADEDCLENVESFNHAFLFSIETQTTIGYGNKFVEGKCGGGTILLIIQSIVGMLIDALLMGTIFAKISRPQQRAVLIQFTKKCVICERDGKLCIMFRVADMHGTSDQIADAHIRLSMFHTRVTEEGEEIPFHHVQLDVGYESGDDRLFLVVPATVVHTIDESSPLHGMTLDEMRQQRCELVAIFEGVVEVTGSTLHARTSYIPDDIEVESRFLPVCKREEDGSCHVNFKNFDEVEPASFRSPRKIYRSSSIIDDDYLDAVHAEDEGLRRSSSHFEVGISKAGFTRLSSLGSDSIDDGCSESETNINVNHDNSIQDDVFIEGNTDSSSLYVEDDDLDQSTDVYKLSKTSVLSLMDTTEL
eukprot:UC4_evm6s1127